VKDLDEMYKIPEMLTIHAMFSKMLTNSMKMQKGMKSTLHPNKENF
jgi:hypothetical protein